MADTPQRTDPNAPVLVVGLGRFGAATAEELVAQGREVLAVERDPVLVQRYAPSLTHVVEADATDSEALARANTAHPGHATLARRAADDRAAVEACHDVDRLRLSR